MKYVRNRMYYVNKNKRVTQTDSPSRGLLIRGDNNKNSKLKQASKREAKTIKNKEAIAKVKQLKNKQEIYITSRRLRAGTCVNYHKPFRLLLRKHEVFHLNQLYEHSKYNKIKSVLVDYIEFHTFTPKNEKRTRTL